MAASNAQPFEIRDFSGGITDQGFDQLPNRAIELDNFLIGKDKFPFSRYGSEVDDLTNPEIPSGERIGALINYANSDKLFYQSGKSIYYRNPSAFTELLGPSGNPVFSEGTIQSVASFAQWNRHLYTTNDAYSKSMKIFKDDAGAYQVRSAGLPALASTPTVTSAGNGDQKFIYAFAYAYDYTVFDLSYQTIGPTILTSIENTLDPLTDPKTISGIPVLTNGTDENFDLTNIVVHIYRSENDGTFMRKVGEVPNGTTTFIDSIPDVTLASTGEDLYTNDGTVDYDPPPLHKFNHVVSNTGYYAGIKDENGENPYMFGQSVPGIPDTQPIDFRNFVDDEITGISSVRSIPIITCKKYIFRVDQFFDQFGRGNMIPVRISDNAGNISHNSLVQAENGLFWCGNDGLYYTDGYLVKKISGGNNERYKDILKNTTQKTRIIGKFFEKERLIMWTIQRDSANQDNDSFIILDLTWGISDDCSFTTWSGKSFRPSALEIFNNQIYRGDNRGFVLRHAENLTSDRKIDVYRNPADWVSETIIWKLLTIHYNFGGSFFRKYPTRVLLTAGDAGNTTIQITAINDDGKSVRNCKPIRIRRDFIWRDDDFVWRVTDFIWRGAGMIEQWRRFPAKSLRLSYLQLQVTNGFSDITNSDTLGTATFSGSGNTATLNTSGLKWPLDCEDYFLYTESDGYTKGYLITNRTSDTVVAVGDQQDTLPTGSLKWVIRGYKKSEPLYLLGMNIHWTNVSATQETYDSSAAATGENA